MADLTEFWGRLNQGPAVLFLGQDYLRLETGEDPLLCEIATRFGGQPTRACSHYWVEYDIIGGWNLQKLNTNE